MHWHSRPIFGLFQVDLDTLGRVGWFLCVWVGAGWCSAPRLQLTQSLAQCGYARQQQGPSRTEKMQGPAAKWDSPAVPLPRGSTTPGGREELELLRECWAVCREPRPFGKSPPIQKKRNGDRGRTTGPDRLRSRRPRSVGSVCDRNNYPGVTWRETKRPGPWGLLDHSPGGLAWRGIGVPWGLGRGAEALPCLGGCFSRCCCATRLRSRPPLGGRIIRHSAAHLGTFLSAPTVGGMGWEEGWTGGAGPELARPRSARVSVFQLPAGGWWRAGERRP